MAHSEHNRPRGSGMILIVIGILIFVFAPRYIKNDISGALAAVVIGFVIGGLGFYMAFLKKRKS
jgi:drug/metabolite transporter (DMT)-like permease